MGFGYPRGFNPEGGNFKSLGEKGGECNFKGGKGGEAQMARGSFYPGGWGEKGGGRDVEQRGG